MGSTTSKVRSVRLSNDVDAALVKAAGGADKANAHLQRMVIDLLTGKAEGVNTGQSVNTAPKAKQQPATGRADLSSLRSTPDTERHEKTGHRLGCLCLLCKPPKKDG